MQFEKMEFRESRIARGGHMQTLAGLFLPVKELVRLSPTVHQVPTSDGDQLALHEDKPRSLGQQCATSSSAILLVHGLGGCHASPYMERIAARLTAAGQHVFRLDMRGCGAGAALASHLTHCGRSGDVAAALRYISQVEPHARVVVAGFSLGGTLALNLVSGYSAGQEGAAAPDNLEAVIAVCPPIDLPHLATHFQTWKALPYNRYFVRRLWAQVQRRTAVRERLLAMGIEQRPKTLYLFDDRITARLSGFESADHYYAATSPGPRLDAIRVPTRILAAANDPVVPPDGLHRFRRSGEVGVWMTRSGGHLGYVGRNQRYWMEETVCRWIGDLLGAVPDQLPVAAPLSRGGRLAKTS